MDPSHRLARGLHLRRANAPPLQPRLPEDGPVAADGARVRSSIPGQYRRAVGHAADHRREKVLCRQAPHHARVGSEPTRIAAVCRSLNIRDFSSQHLFCIPGHGGVLDRFASQLATVLSVLLYLRYDHAADAITDMITTHVRRTRLCFVLSVCLNEDALCRSSFRG
eukprot:scaffold396_cov252-Pinguiococcus_pyrenoidosus.AAC.7